LKIWVSFIFVRLEQRIGAGKINLLSPEIVFAVIGKVLRKEVQPKEAVEARANFQYHDIYNIINRAYYISAAVLLNILLLFLIGQPL